MSRNVYVRKTEVILLIGDKGDKQLLYSKGDITNKS